VNNNTNNGLYDTFSLTQCSSLPNIFYLCVHVIYISWIRRVQNNILLTFMVRW